MMDDNRYTDDVLFKAANDIYSLYFIGWLIGFLAFIIGAVWAGLKRQQAVGLTQSHFYFQVTMAIQGIVVLLILSLLNGLWYWLYAGAWLKLVITASSIGYIWWWLARSIAGYRLLSRQQAIANPQTWGKPFAADRPKQSIEE